ncbi:hypothetical protein GCM10020216_105520 [Nonomuraea helvata]
MREMYEADLAAGLEPFLLVGTAGTTAGGVLDRLPELAALARQWGVHFHVDAAWAGAVALSDRTPHARALAESFRVATSYMPAESGELPDPYVTSVQWSRRFAGLKVFLALAIAGRPGAQHGLARRRRPSRGQQRAGVGQHRTAGRASRHPPLPDQPSHHRGRRRGRGDRPRTGPQASLTTGVARAADQEAEVSFARSGA